MLDACHGGLWDRPGENQLQPTASLEFDNTLSDMSDITPGQPLSTLAQLTSIKQCLVTHVL